GQPEKSSRAEASGAWGAASSRPLRREEGGRVGRPLGSFWSCPWRSHVLTVSLRPGAPDRRGTGVVRQKKQFSSWHEPRLPVRDGLHRFSSGPRLTRESWPDTALQGSGRRVSGVQDSQST
uniref:Uncharacterized protein n=1 Tax=Mustela putorius furo TaxID=9669 RepID=M3YNE8_MUSPF